MQATLQKSVSTAGVALHAGVDVALSIAPAPADTGFVFVRTDLGGARIPARPEAVIEALLGTCIANADGASVKTIEHLLAAFFIAGVDNAEIALDGPEPPILDGSAGDFLALIDEAGRAALQVPKKRIAVKAPLEVRDGDRYVRIEPAAERSANVTIDFEDAAIGTQSVSLDLDDADMLRTRLASARTFCRLSDIEAMRAAGLAQGGSLDNAIVVDGAKILNQNGLRDPAEFVLHKALDLIGDLALVGAVIEGRIIAHKPGHDLNTALAAKVADLLG